MFFFSWGLSAVNGNTRQKDRKREVERGMQQGEEADPALGSTKEVLTGKCTIDREEGSGAGDPNSPCGVKGTRRERKLHRGRDGKRGQTQGSRGGEMREVMLLVVCTCLGWSGEDCLWAGTNSRVG